MSDHITLPRAVGERLYDLLLDRIDGVYHASSEDIALRDALDAALAEPESDAKREPATHEQVCTAYESSKYEGRLDDFSEGWREAERFHGIRKEDKT